MSASTEIALTRRVRFSSGHRYWDSRLSEAENRQLFGKWASRFNHGHNYVLEATVTGTVDEATGMVVNIKQIDDVLDEHVVASFDGKSLNDEVEAFRERQPSIENLLQTIRQILEGPGILPSRTELSGLRLVETEDLYGETKMETGWTVAITRTYEFAAAHRLHSPSLSEAQNAELFGKCNNPAGHGHNFVLEVTVEGIPDHTTGMIADIEAIDGVVNREVVDRYDHKHLNIDIPEFQERVVTSEVLASEIFARLESLMPAKLRRVRLFETDRSWFDVEAAP